MQKNCLLVLLKESIYHGCKTQKIAAPFFGSVVSLNRPRSIRSILPATFKCLYNVVSLCRFSFCLNCKVDVVFVVVGSVNAVSASILLVSGFL